MREDVLAIGQVMAGIAYLSDKPLDKGISVSELEGHLMGIGEVNLTTARSSIEMALRCGVIYQDKEIVYLRTREHVLGKYR